MCQCSIALSASSRRNLLFFTWARRCLKAAANDPRSQEPVQGAAGEVGHRFCVLVVVDLCVGKAGVIVDNGVDELLAGSSEPWVRLR